MDLNGTLVQSTGEPAIDELRPLPGAFAALRALTEVGFACPVITVQGRISAGAFTEETFRRWYREFATIAHHHGARLDGLYLCPHRAEDGCRCRKPLTWLYRQAADDLAADVHRSWVIGDTGPDLQAAHDLGVRSILVRTGHGSRAAHDPVPRDRVVGTIVDAVEHILQHAGTTSPGTSTSPTRDPLNVCDTGTHPAAQIHR